MRNFHATGLMTNGEIAVGANPSSTQYPGFYPLHDLYFQGRDDALYHAAHDVRLGTFSPPLLIVPADQVMSSTSLLYSPT